MTDSGQEDAQKAPHQPQSSGPPSGARPSPGRVLFLILAMVVLGLVFAGVPLACVSVWYVNHCGGQPGQPQLCDLLNKNPPWVLLSSFAAAPAILLTWYWRTVHKDTDIRQKQLELDLAERDHQRQVADAAARQDEVSEQLTLQKMQMDQAREQQFEQARARQKEVDAQNAAATRAHETARDTQLLDTYFRGVDALASDNQPHRLAGIALVAQVGRDSEKLRVPALETLAAFIREHGGVRNPNVQADVNIRMVGTALQAFASVPKTGSQIDLREILLVDVSVRDGDLRRVNLKGSTFRNVAFVAVEMKKTILAECTGSDVSFFQCVCESTSFVSSKIERLAVTGSKFGYAEFGDAQIDFVSWSGPKDFERALYTRGSRLTVEGKPLDCDGLQMILRGG